MTPQSIIDHYRILKKSTSQQHQVLLTSLRQANAGKLTILHKVY